MRTLVTGGAGYIGSHVVLELLDSGHDVVVVDDLSTGRRELVDDRAELIVADIASREVAELLQEREIEAVLHFAGSIVVPESVADPLKYYLNNTSKTRTLIEACVEHQVGYFIFSSTAAVYGDAKELPVTEQTPTAPITPYGRSKLMTEWMLKDVSAAHALRFVALRYFNVAGADPKGRTGQATPQATHLIKVATQAALGQREGLSIFGTDYPTPDGTCVRDYIHVTDLADVHVRALDYLAEGGESAILNCGYGRGFSVRDVARAVREVSSVDFPIQDSPRRPGDPAELIADPSTLRELFEWAPRYDDLEYIVKTALEWERQMDRFKD